MRISLNKVIDIDIKSGQVPPEGRHKLKPNKYPLMYLISKPSLTQSTEGDQYLIRGLLRAHWTGKYYNPSVAHTRYTTVLVRDIK